MSSKTVVAQVRNIASGTPVYAAESGTVAGSDSSKRAASYPACRTQSPAPQPNFVKIQGSDGYYTVYAHVKPTVTQGQVTAGQQIGVTDTSGCQSNPHIHMTRRDANGNFYNFHLPCGNAEPTSSFSDGLIDDNVDPI
jgi:murein DD-endopeptidase MepM/ murein hydrolase activator NlpD